MDFKNSFAWLTGIKKSIFDYNNTFGSGYFLTCFSDLIVYSVKRVGAKKVVIIKNQFFHARQPHKGIFAIYPLLGCFLMTSFPELPMAAAIPGVEIFSWKSAWVVFFYMQNSKFWVNPESERTGFALLPNWNWSQFLEKSTLWGQKGQRSGLLSISPLLS